MPGLKSASLGYTLKVTIQLPQLTMIVSSQNHTQRQEESRRASPGAYVSFYQGDKFIEAPSIYLGPIGQKWSTCSPLNQSLERGLGLPLWV